MNLHTSREKPDWEYGSAGTMTRWQAIAVTTHGVITPGNIISVTGLAIVIWGSILLYHGDTASGLLLVLLGRIMDLLDGIVAEATKTKSQLGEAVDTTCDKLSVFVTSFAAYVVGLFSPFLIITLILHHGFTAIYSLLFARRYGIHTTRFGKYAMFASWVAIISSLFSTIHQGTILTIVITVITFLYAIMALVACTDYIQVLYDKKAERLRIAQWTKSVDTIIYVFNSKATNFKRSERWIKRITRRMECQRINIPIAKAQDKLLNEVKKYATSDDKQVLVAVAGGDGTVSSVANILLHSKAKKSVDRCLFLPLWGGNANDFAFMLNGLTSNNTAARLLAQSGPVEVPFIDIVMKDAKQTRQIFAGCYASFGASAYAARQLDTKRIASNKLVHYFPLIIIARELVAVVKALIDAPVFSTQSESGKMNSYEHTFINGSRIAKINRVPLSLKEPAFFHAVIDQKHPSYLIEIGKIIMKRSKKEYVKRKNVSFQVHDQIHAQIDGEVYDLQPGTKIEVGVHGHKLRCISTKL